MTSPKPKRLEDDEEPPSPATAKFFHTMSDDEKRFSFKTTMKWDEFGNLVAMAGCNTDNEDGIART
eukprot:CAMPEP_0205917250 /NCGR_PEP_ID=MMETSP1325-20131115/9045_1 /ASSEMBLY_ACC=CAM_ASM_000708 /TAXON_ID=236786 /ORGANISM="Florenciella sp., Strain RCC1007" /LENGTH=65 /DNA_ID=CAMNT_0053284643 /DNA_START=42 /DNA_END=236 /DNA_ORIENTATION=+